VGHSLVNDLKALMLTHPKDLIRDTARYKLKRVSGHFHDTVRSFKPYMRASGASGMDIRPRKLKEIAKQFLGMDIQQGEHDPVRTAVYSQKHFVKRPY
jgi:RNA exonuclease 4